MTELRTEAQDVRTETLEAPGATLAYDTRSAEAESAAPGVLMIASPMDASGFTTLAQGGERTIERPLSVDQTCRLQRRSFYSYRADALTAKARGDPVPSLMRA